MTAQNLGQREPKNDKLHESTGTRQPHKNGDKQDTIMQRFRSKTSVVKINSGDKFYINGQQFLVHENCQKDKVSDKLYKVEAFLFLIHHH